MNKPNEEEAWFATQQKLMEDERGIERDALLHKLAENIRAIKRQMDTGVTPGEFARLDKLRQGLEAAVDVVARTWQRYHPA